MGVLKRLVPAAALLAVSTLAACSEAAAPVNLDSGSLEAGFSTATATFSNNAAFQSLAALSFHFPQYAATAALRAALPAPPLAGAGAAARARARAASLRLFASLRSPQALFPANVLGKTLEWDTLSRAYVVGSAAGAPASGIRILLYTVNPATGEPAVPLQPLGYVDLTDKSSPAADRLGVLLLLGTTTVADYDVVLSVGTTITTYEAVGFIRTAQGTDRVDFDFLDVIDFQAQTISSTSQLTGADATAIFVDVEQTITSVSLTVRVQQGSSRIEMAVTINDVTSAVTGTVKFNTVVVATISGTLDAPQFTGAGGRTLGPVETVRLVSIFAQAVSVASEVGSAVFGPASIVFN